MLLLYTSSRFTRWILGSWKRFQKILSYRSLGLRTEGMVYCCSEPFGRTWNRSRIGSLCCDSIVFFAISHGSTDRQTGSQDSQPPPPPSRGLASSLQFPTATRLLPAKGCSRTQGALEFRPSIFCCCVDFFYLFFHLICISIW